jgi:hypothetical protein
MKSRVNSLPITLIWFFTGLIAEGRDLKNEVVRIWLKLDT